MKLKTVVCHTHLMSMLLQPEKFQNAITSYTASSPDVANEGFNGYMEVTVEFCIKDLAKFTALYDESRVFPSDRAAWYNVIRSSMIRFEK